MNPVELRDFLDKYFNDDELRGLCFELDIPYEDLGASTKSGKARELVSYCQRHTRLAELEAACLRLRPDIPNAPVPPTPADRPSARSSW